MKLFDVMDAHRLRAKQFERAPVLGFFVVSAVAFFLLFCLVGSQYGLLLPARAGGGGGGGGSARLGLWFVGGAGGVRRDSGGQNGSGSRALGGLGENRSETLKNLGVGPVRGGGGGEDGRGPRALGLGVVAAGGDKGGDGSKELWQAGAGGECDWFDGEWVWDESYPLYKSKSCPFMDEGFRCSENGRSDQNYTKWRWRPARCHLSRFSAKDMLERMRNKRVVFVGDSIGRNQWESLLCMLSTAVRNKKSIYEVDGRPITKHNGFLIFMFKDYNLTVAYYRAPFLVVQGRVPGGAPKEAKTTLRLDVMDWFSPRWKDADVLVFNTGHWWNYEKTIRAGSYFQVGSEVKMNMSVEDAYQRAIRTMFNWIRNEVNTSKTQVIFRTYAPVHFRGGNWKSGGSCHMETLPEPGSSPVSLEPWANLLQPFKNVTAVDSVGSPVVDLDVLNITHMTARRKDGHLSLFYMGPSHIAPLHKQDCSHWCLPGVPDTWNELLYNLILRRDSMIRENRKILGTNRVTLSQ